MRVYQLHIAPSECDAEGEDHDEWFSSLIAAQRRRADLIAEGPDLKYGEDFAIDAVDLAQLAPKTLALALLNRKGFVKSRRRVVGPYRPESKADQMKRIRPRRSGS